MSVGQETFELTSWIERARKRPKSSEPRDEAPSSRPSYESRFDYRKADETTFEPRSFAREMQRAEREERIDHEVLGRDEIEAHAVTPESPEAIEAVEAEPVAEAVMGEVPNALAAGVVFEEAVAEAVAEGGLAEAAAKPADAPAIEAGQDEAVADTLVLLEEAEPEPAVEESVLEVVEAESVVAPAPEAEERAQPLEELEERLEASTDHIEVEVEAVALPAQAEAEARSDEPTESDNSKAGFISIEPFDIVVHTNGHSKVEPSEPPSEVSDAPEAHVQAGAGETEDDETGQTFDIRIDIQLKPSRAMNVKRWEVKENPFDGFKSPPGRF
jgi:hypothetical protein